MNCGAAVRTAVIGFVAGSSVLPNEWFHLGWLLLAGCFALGRADGPAKLLRWSAHTGSMLAALFLLWMTARSCFSEAFIHGHDSVEIIRGMLGVALLVLFCALVWRLAHDREALCAAGWIAGMTSAFAALLSLILSYFVLPGHHAGERLTNLLVHGGLNPVCSGLIFGFSALWLASLAEEPASPLPRHLIWPAITLLHFTTFLSASRGAMLALACGHAALFIARGWRRGAAAVSVFIITGTIYFISAPFMAGKATWHVQEPMVNTVPAITQHWQQAVERGDNGRFEIYRAGWKAIDNIWIGTGQWGMRDVWQCELQPGGNTMAYHLHSAFFATFVHGGIIGAVLLLVLLAYGVRCAGRIATQGDATWIALLALGCGGLLFDGESLTSLATAPRIEGLLFWLPLTVVLARGSVTSPTAPA
jgi:hypothetical protein